MLPLHHGPARSVSISSSPVSLSPSLTPLFDSCSLDSFDFLFCFLLPLQDEAMVWTGGVEPPVLIARGLQPGELADAQRPHEILRHSFQEGGQGGSREPCCSALRLASSSTCILDSWFQFIFDPFIRFLIFVCLDVARFIRPYIARRRADINLETHVSRGASARRP